MAIDLQTATTEQLKRVIEIREQIDALQNQLNQIAGGEVPTPGPAPSKRGRPPGKRYFSPAARQAMAEAARKRWAVRKKGDGAPAKMEATPKGKRTMSPEGRARIAAAAKKRWAAKRKADKAAMAGAPVSAPAKGAKPAAKRNVNPKLLEYLAKARAVRLAKLKAAKAAA